MAIPGPRVRRWRRILIVKPSSLGDIIHALPVLAALRAAYPRAHVAWLVNSSFASLLDGHPMLDEVIPFDRGRYGGMWRNSSSLGEFLALVRRIRRRRFDLVVDLQGLFRSGFLAWVSGAPHRVGFSAARELAPLFYSHRVVCPTGIRHAVEKNACVVAALGAPASPPTFPLAPAPAETVAAQNLLATAAGRPIEHFAAILPGARWPSKLWPAERVAALIDLLHREASSPCVLLGGQSDRNIANDVKRACTTAVVDLVGKTTLRQLVALLSLANRVVCQDSGPMHIAAALGKPTVALFGPTDPARTGPYSTRARVVALPLPCAPCFRRVCPLGHHNCMRELSAEAVLAHVRELPTS